MSTRSDNQNEVPRVSDGRRRELRELLVSAANAARLTRQSAADAAMNRSAPRAVRERMAIFLAGAR